MHLAYSAPAWRRNEHHPFHIIFDWPHIRRRCALCNQPPEHDCHVDGDKIHITLPSAGRRHGWIKTPILLLVIESSWDPEISARVVEACREDA